MSLCLRRIKPNTLIITYKTFFIAMLCLAKVLFGQFFYHIFKKIQYKPLNMPKDIKMHVYSQRIQNWSQVQDGNTIIKLSKEEIGKTNLIINPGFRLKIKNPFKLVVLSQIIFWSSPVILPFLLECSCKQVSKFGERPDSMNPPTQFCKHSGFCMWYRSGITWKSVLSLYPCHCVDFFSSM